jgi:hypothetical protein
MRSRHRAGTTRTRRSVGLVASKATPPLAANRSAHETPLARSSGNGIFSGNVARHYGAVSGGTRVCV